MYAALSPGSPIELTCRASREPKPKAPKKEVVEEVELGDFARAVARLALHENLPDERGDGFHGIRHGEEPGRRYARAGETLMNALAHGPYFGLPAESGDSLQCFIDYHFIEPAQYPITCSANATIGLRLSA